MALGRVFGPLLGGVLISQGSTASLGLVAAGVMVGASGLLLSVDRDRFKVSLAVGFSLPMSGTVESVADAASRRE